MRLTFIANACNVVEGVKETAVGSRMFAENSYLAGGGE